jgi:hypothetical protein
MSMAAPYAESRSLSGVLITLSFLRNPKRKENHFLADEELHIGLRDPQEKYEVMGTPLVANCGRMPKETQ